MSAEGVDAAEGSRVEAITETPRTQAQFHVLVGAERNEVVLVGGTEHHAVHLLRVACTTPQSPPSHAHALHEATLAQVPDLHVGVLAAAEDQTAHVARADGGDGLVVL